eukprot:gnl/TRDRNA2_/TRDRNA2_169782_c0_seq2.p1 gnl/TRDRNA2_/TRDRNA2_169782_c0~~gnl/TRDRNA2_/TRDRNA2_169782_c0_seq2.p1  ORF type:complete len:385 (+),score=62.45 gnl/TRDRNA2_/TRDRNA2_169782_c0_seq2:145-1155(+)
MAAAESRARAEPTTQSGAFGFFAARCKRDAEVASLLSELGESLSRRNAAMQKLIGLGAEAIDAVAGSRRGLKNLTAAYYAAAAERQLLDDWSAKAWQELLSGPHESDLEEGGLILSQWADPASCDPAAVRAQLEEFADAVRASLPPLPAGGGRYAPRDLADTVSHVLFGVHGFRGATQNDSPKGYYDQRNSFFAQVLRRRVGIPISLGTLFAAVARRVGLGSGLCAAFPAHVLVRAFVNANGQQGPGDLFLDAFKGGEKVPDLNEFAGRRLPSECSEASAPAAVYARMLRNLANIYEAFVRHLSAAHPLVRGKRSVADPIQAFAMGTSVARGYSST